MEYAVTTIFTGRAMNLGGYRQTRCARSSPTSVGRLGHEQATTPKCRPATKHRSPDQQIHSQPNSAFRRDQEWAAAIQTVSHLPFPAALICWCAPELRHATVIERSVEYLNAIGG